MLWCLTEIFIYWISVNYKEISLAYYNNWEFFFFLWWKLLGFTTFILTYVSVHYTYCVVYHIPSTSLSYNWKSVLLVCLHPVPPLPPLTSGNHKYDHFFHVCFWSIANTMLVPVTQHSIIRYFYTFQSKHHKSSCDLSPYKHIT